MSIARLFFLTALACFANTDRALSISIVTIGDSIVQTYPVDFSIWGWGYTLPSMFNSQPIWTNLAVSGESTKSYIDEGLWANAVGQHANWMFIEFGHNDSHSYDPTHYTDPSTTFRDNLRKFADEARGAGTEPIFVTPAARRGGPANDETLPLYTNAMIAVGQEKNVGVIDLHASTLALYDQLGPSAQAILGPSGSDDVTHFGHYGAEQLARIIAGAIPTQDAALAAYVVPDHILPGQDFSVSNVTRDQFTIDGTLRTGGGRYLILPMSRQEPPDCWKKRTPPLRIGPAPFRSAAAAN